MSTALPKCDPGLKPPVPPTPKWLLLFAFYFPPVNESGAQRPFRFARYLRRHGYRTRVITASPQTVDKPWPDVTEAPGGRVCGLKTELVSRAGGAIQRLLPYNDQLPWVAHAAAVAGSLIPAIKPAAILSTSPPVGCHLAALRMKWRYGLPWVADLRDPIYGNPHRSRRFSGPYEALVERLILKNADAVIANTDLAAEALRRRHPHMAHKVHLIWNGYDPEQALIPLPLPERTHKLILHAGSLYAGRHPGDLVESLGRLIGSGRLDPASIRLRLIGELDRTHAWLSTPAHHELRAKGCIEYLDRMLPQSEALREMAQAEYLLLLDASGTGLQVPAKLFQYIRIGRPILAFTPKDSPCERILANSGVRHVAIAPGLSEEQVDERVATMCALPADPVPPSDWFEERFNGEAQTRTLASILQTVTR